MEVTWLQGENYASHNPSLSTNCKALHSSEYLRHAQTPTPGSTPTSGRFPTPVLDTAQLSQSHIAEALGSWTPTTIANSTALDPSFQSQSPLTPNLPSHSFLEKLGHEHQLPSPPNTVSRGKGGFAPNLNMQDDQNFGQPAFLVTSQSQGMDALLEGTSDMFDYPMSAPGTGPDSFWDDTGMSFNMDMSFVDSSTIDWSQPMTPSHRPSGSFDYNTEVNLFAPPQPPQPVPSSAHPEPIRPAPVQRRERALAPKPPTANGSARAGSSTNPKTTTYHPNLAEPFSIINPGGQSGSFLGRPQTSTGEMSFQFTNESGAIQQNGLSETGNQPSKVGARRSSATARGAKNSKLPDRASASSPIKSASSRPGLGRSFSESRGRKSAVRSKMTPQTATSRIDTHVIGSSSVAGQVALPSGRVSPVKTQSHSSTLRTIPEVVPRRAPASNVEFLIVNGRAEARLVKAPPKVKGSHTSESSEDSSDDEPIHLPNQATSRNTSFALPDPVKPIGSIFDSMDDQDYIESEAETVMNENHGEKSDASSEIHRVLERQRQMKQANGGRSQSFQQRTRNGLYQDALSPSSSGSGGVGGRNIRCVCSRTGAEKDAGYLIKWYVWNDNQLGSVWD